MPIITWYEYSHTHSRTHFFPLFRHTHITVYQSSKYIALRECRIRNICPKYHCEPTLPLKWLMSIADTLICYVYLFIYLCDMYTVHRFTLNCWYCRTYANYVQIGKTVFIFGTHCQTFVCLFVGFFLNVPCVTNFWLLFYMKML